jgi:hypothetical protein
MGRGGRLPSRPRDQYDAGGQQRDRQQLSHRRAEDQVAELHVGLAEQLARHPRNRVAGEKQAADHSGMIPGAGAFGGKQHQEQQQPLTGGLVKLARMARHRSAGGEHDRPGHVRRPSEQFAVDEVRDASEKQPDRHRCANDVGERQSRDAAPAGEQPNCGNHAERAAMERHPAVPQVERLQLVFEVVARLVEQDIADAAAEHDGERRPYQEIVDIIAPHPARRAVGQCQAIPPAEQQAGDIGQRIPANRERSDSYCDRIYRGKRNGEKRHRR